MRDLRLRGRVHGQHRSAERWDCRRGHAVANRARLPGGHHAAAIGLLGGKSMTAMTPEDRARLAEIREWYRKRPSVENEEDDCQWLLRLLDAATAGKPAGEF